MLQQPRIVAAASPPVRNPLFFVVIPGGSGWEPVTFNRMLRIRRKQKALMTPRRKQWLRFEKVKFLTLQIFFFKWNSISGWFSEFQLLNPIKSYPSYMQHLTWWPCESLFSSGSSGCEDFGDTATSEADSDANSMMLMIASAWSWVMWTFALPDASHHVQCVFHQVVSRGMLG